MLSVDDIPFEHQAARNLLGLELDSPQGDDFYVHGWCRPGSVWLDDGRVRCIEAPLLVGVHTPDEPEPGPLCLEFWFEHGGEEVAARVAWERFAARKVVPVLGPEADVVLALCNPQHKPVVRPPGFGARTLHAADGDVTAWLDNPRGPSPQIRLTAQRWRTLDAEPV